MAKKFILLLIGLSSLSCTTQWVGSSGNEFITYPGCEISPEEALELAEPLLEETFRLRTEGRESRAGSHLNPFDHIVLRGNWYYIARDNYPYKTIEAYRFHAVMVHKKTGEVIPPKSGIR